MTKTYWLNQNLNNATFTLTAGKGNQLQFVFRGGNVITNTPAWCMLESEYCQQVLENSELFKQGRVVYSDETRKQVAKAAQEAKQKAAEKKAVDEVTSVAVDMVLVGSVKTVAEAQNYVAEHFGQSAKTAAQAKKIANENGVDFPNLRLGKSN